MLNKSFSPAIIYTCHTFTMTPKKVAEYDTLGGPYKWDQTGHVGACFSPEHHSVFMRIDNNRVRTMYQTYTAQDGEPETPEDLSALVDAAPYHDWQKRAVALVCLPESNEDDISPPSRTKGGSDPFFLYIVPCAFSRLLQ